MTAKRDGKKTGYSVKVLYKDRSKDLCILTGIPDLKGLSIETTKPEIGQKITAIGHPWLGPLKASKGILYMQQPIEVPTREDIESCKNGGRWVSYSFFGETREFCVRQYDSYWSDAEIHPGNSGSPVINSSGRVTAVVFAGGGGFSYFLPLYSLKEFLADAESQVLRQETLEQ